MVARLRDLSREEREVLYPVPKGSRTVHVHQGYYGIAETLAHAGILIRSTSGDSHNGKLRAYIVEDRAFLYLRAHPACLDAIAGDG